MLLAEKIAKCLEIIEKRPDLRLIEGSFGGISKLATFECLKDASHGSWQQKAGRIAYESFGCPKCNNFTLTTDQTIASKLMPKGLELVSRHGNLLAPVQLRCVIHNKTYSLSQLRIALDPKHNCKICKVEQSKQIKEQKRLEKLLAPKKERPKYGMKKDLAWSKTVRLTKDRNLKPIDPQWHQDNHPLMRFVCGTNATHIWECRYASVISTNQSGCPYCNRTGYTWGADKGTMYILSVMKENATVAIKLGVTAEHIERRIKDIARTNPSLQYQLIKTVNGSAKHIGSLERSIKKRYPSLQLDDAVGQGKRELFSVLHYKQIESEVMRVN